MSETPDPKEVGTAKMTVPDMDNGGEKLVAEGKVYEVQDKLIAKMQSVTRNGKSQVGGGSKTYTENWGNIFKGDPNNN